MQASIRNAAILVLAATSGYFARRAPHETPQVAAPPAATAVRHEKIETPALAVETMGSVPEAYAGKRNLFAYVEAPAPLPPHIEAVVPAAAPIAPIVAPPVQQAAKPEPPRFPYRYIGTFGTAQTRLAIFKRDGDIHNVRVGERIDADWTLRSIGLESVEVEAWRTGDRVQVSPGVDL